MDEQLDPRERELAEDEESRELDAEERRLAAAQQAAREAGAPALELEVGDEVGLDVPKSEPPAAKPTAEQPPAVTVEIESHPEGGDYVVLKVDGAERARKPLAEVDPEVLAQAKAEPDARKQAALLWPTEPEETTAAEGLARQMAQAEEKAGTLYLIFSVRDDLFEITNSEDASSYGKLLFEPTAIKTLGSSADFALNALVPLGSGTFTGAPAALVAARERWGAGSYVAIPRRNMTGKRWQAEQVTKWV